MRPFYKEIFLQACIWPKLSIHAIEESRSKNVIQLDTEKVPTKRVYFFPLLARDIVNEKMCYDTLVMTSYD